MKREPSVINDIRKPRNRSTGLQVVVVISYNYLVGLGVDPYRNNG